MSRYDVNRLIQELFSVPGALADFRNDRAGVYDRHEITPDERSALDSGAPDALTELGVHPILQMHWMLASNPGAAEFITAKAYMGRGAP